MEINSPILAVPAAKIRDIDGETNDLAKATKINEYFINIAEQLSKEIDDDLLDENILVNDVAYPPVFEFREISDYELAILLRELSPSTSCGVDGITARLIKTAGPALIAPIRYIINLSINK